MTSGLPSDVTRFIAEYIGSVADLELLLLLSRDSTREWAAAEAGETLYTNPDMCATQLERLCSQKLAAKTIGPAEPNYRYAPQDPQTATVIEKLAALYTERRVSIITVIYSKPLSKVQSLADAFRWRKRS